MELLGTLRDFEFKKHAGPIGDLKVACCTVAAYLCLLFLIKRYVAAYGAWHLKTWEVTHNAFLSAASAVLLVAMAIEVHRMIDSSSFMSVLTDFEVKHTQKGLMIFYYWLNLALKYVELLDTVLLAMRNRPLSFLHVFHHSATLLLALVQLRAETCIQWVVISLNLSVHVIMYAHFALAARFIEWLILRTDPH